MRQVFYKYANLIKNDTPYARKMLQLSNRIFGEPSRPVRQKDKKVLLILSRQPFDKDPWFVDWYPRHVESHQLTQALRSYGLYRYTGHGEVVLYMPDHWIRDEHQDFREEMIRLKELRGKNWMGNMIRKREQEAAKKEKK